MQLTLLLLTELIQAVIETGDSITAEQGARISSNTDWAPGSLNYKNKKSQKNYHHVVC